MVPYQWSIRICRHVISNSNRKEGVGKEGWRGRKKGLWRWGRRGGEGGRRVYGGGEGGVEGRVRKEEMVGKGEGNGGER